MTKYLAGVLTVIAVGVLLVAYGLLTPRTSMDAMSLSPIARPIMAEPITQALPLTQAPQAAGVPYGVVSYPAASYASAPAQVVTYVPASTQAYAPPMAVAQAPRPVQMVTYQPERRVRSAEARRVERQPRRDWKRTALIIGGSSAAGAGIGGIVGGKKGALIGAAIAGGASTLLQTVKQD